VTSEEQTYAAAFARAIAADVSAHPPVGALARIVVRWFETDDPLYFTVHALGSEERAAVAAGEAWYPLEWQDVDREMERTGRLSGDAEVLRAGAALRPQYEEAADDADEDGEPGPSAATVEAVRRLPDALRAAGVELDQHFAVSAAHFEGWGALAVLRRVATPELLAALAARDELPEE
jgi:hypothetical protein